MRLDLRLDLKKHSVKLSRLKYGCTLVLAFFVLANVSSALAKDSDVLGVWRTQTNDEGSYLHVEIKQCEKNLCGTIIEAFRKGDEKIEDYENAGKRMIWAMKVQGNGKWAGGKIWAPDTNKTYSSRMALQAEGAELKVSGCIAAGLICRSQKWTKTEAGT